MDLRTCGYWLETPSIESKTLSHCNQNPENGQGEHNNSLSNVQFLSVIKIKGKKKEFTENTIMLKLY